SMAYFIRMSTDGSFDTVSTGIAPNAMVLGPDGNVWYVWSGGARRMLPNGTITSVPLSLNATPTSITVGPDNAIWVTAVCCRIGRITTADLQSSYVEVPNPSGGLNAIAKGSDGAVWVGEKWAGRMAKLILDDHPISGTARSMCLDGKHYSGIVAS